MSVHFVNSRDPLDATTRQKAFVVLLTDGDLVGLAMVPTGGTNYHAA